MDNDYVSSKRAHRQAIIEIERKLSHELSVNFIITLKYNITTRLCERAIPIGTSSRRDWSSQSSVRKENMSQKQTAQAYAFSHLHSRTFYQVYWERNGERKKASVKMSNANGRWKINSACRSNKFLAWEFWNGRPRSRTFFIFVNNHVVRQNRWSEGYGSTRSP